ncbi:hypothetical protein JHK87_050804 [Glycine soja]|nr:hypothetical protein JHK87_050804 [Glycine soja]
MYTLENVDPMGGPVSEIGPVIKVHAMPINCSAENVVETVTEECTQNGIEDMDDDGAKGGSDDENEVVGFGVQDVETEVVETTVETELEVVGVETEVNSDADDDEVKERDGDVDFFYHFESDSDYVYVSPEDDGQSKLDLRSAIMKQELMSIYKTNHAHVGCGNFQNEINCFQFAPQVEQPSTNLEITPTPNAENASTQNVPTPSHCPPMSTAFRPSPLRPPAPI